MRKTISLAIFAMFAIAGSAGIAQTSTSAKYDKLKGSYLKWIIAAEPEIQHERLNLENYNIEVVEEKETVTVMLISSDAPDEPRCCGNPGSHPGFEVTISRKDEKVISHSYIK